MASTSFLAEQLDLKSIGPNADSQKSAENEIRSGIPCWKDDNPTYCDPPKLFQPSTEVLRFDLEDGTSKLFPSDVGPSAETTAPSRASIVFSKASNLSLAVSEVREAADLELRIQRGFVPMRVLSVHADRMLDTMKEMLEKLNFFRVLPQVISEISIDDSRFPLPKEFEASLLQLLHVQATWQYIDDQTPQPTSKFLRRLMHFAQSKLEQGIPAPTASLSLIPKSRHPALQDEEKQSLSPFQNRSKSAALPSDCYRADTAKTIADSLTDLKQLYDWDAETDALGAEMEHSINKKLRSKMLEVMGLSSSAASGALEDFFGGAQDFLATKKPKKKLRICRLQRDGSKCCEAYSKARTRRPKTKQQQDYAYEESDEDDQQRACSALDAVLDDVYNLGLDRYIFKGLQKGPNSKQTCTVNDMSAGKRLEVLAQLAIKKPNFFKSLVTEAVDWSCPETQSDRSLLLLSAVKGKFGKQILGAILEENIDSVLQYVQLHVDHYKALYADEDQKCQDSEDRQKQNSSSIDTWRQKWRQHLGASEDEEQNAGNSNWKLLRNNKTKQMILMKKYKDSQGQWRTRKIPLNDQGQPEILEEKRMRKAGSKLTSEDLSKLAELREEFGEDMPVVALKKYLWRVRRAEKTKLNDESDQQIGAFDEFYETSDDSSEIPEDETDLSLLKVQDASPANAPTSKNTKTLPGFLGLPPESDQGKIDLLTPTLNPGRWNHIEKLIAGGNHNIGAELIERHLRGAYREAFRQAYLNKDKLTKYVEDLLAGARGTRALRLFVGQFQALLCLMQERMLVTPEEEVMKIHVLRQTWIREQRLLQLLEGLKNKYSDLRSERDLKIAKLNETISSLMTQIDTVYAHTRQELSMVISEYSKMELLTNKSADHSQQGLQGVLQRCVAAGSAFRAKYAEIEEDLQKQKRKHEAELEAVIAQYDTEMFDRQARLDKLEQDFKEQQVEVDKLEEELKKVERRTGQMEDEERKKQLKRRKRKKRKKRKSKKRSKKGKKGRSRSRKSKKRKGKSKKKRSKKKSKESKTASDTEDEYVSDEETEDEEEETDAEESEEQVVEKPSKPKKAKKKSKKNVSKTAKKSKKPKSPSKSTKKTKKKTLKLSPEDVEPTSDTEEEADEDQEEMEAGGDAPPKKPSARGRKKSKKSKRKPAKTAGETAAASVTSTNSLSEPQKISSSAEVGSEASLKTSVTETTAKSVSTTSEVASKKLKKHSKKKSKKRSKSRKKSKKRKRKSRK